MPCMSCIDTLLVNCYWLTSKVKNPVMVILRFVPFGLMVYGTLTEMRSCSVDWPLSRNWNELSTIKFSFQCSLCCINATEWSTQIPLYLWENACLFPNLDEMTLLKGREQLTVQTRESCRQSISLWPEPIPKVIGYRSIIETNKIRNLWSTWRQFRPVRLVYNRPSETRVCTDWRSGSVFGSFQQTPAVQNMRSML